MKFRPQRGSLEDSMKEIVELLPTREALIAHLYSDHLCMWGDDVHVIPYVYDYRINWDTQAVVVNDYIVGFTNQPLEKSNVQEN